MSCHNRFVYASLLLFSVVYLIPCEAERPCFSTELEQCWIGETCQVQIRDQGGQPNGKCVCLRDYERDPEGRCVPERPFPSMPFPSQVNKEDTDSSSGSIAAGILVPLLFVGVGVLFALCRRYGWWHRLRQPRVRQYDTALVGGDLDDDPPIA